MGLPDAKTLLGITIGSAEDDGDDLADCLREMHGHMVTGNYKAAAEAMRAAHRIAASESTAGSGDSYGDDDT